MDESRIERALRQGPPFATRYTRRPLALGSQAGASGPGWLVIAATAILMLAAASGAAVVGSAVGILRAPVNPPEASAAPNPHSQGSFSATGSMSVALDGPAVLLADGRVLVAGGYDEVGVGLASAELYDPRRGTWTPTESMLEARGAASVTLLADGRVLVAGGQRRDPKTERSAEVDLASAELYDPRTETWTATGDLLAPRAGHLAVLLADGTVLVAGGETEDADGQRSVTSAEVYDPRTETWTSTGPMLEELWSGSTTTLLPDGRVLVAGGTVRDFFGWRDLATTELYDPRTGTWTAGPSMTQARTGHSATLLADGTVLVAGGASTWVRDSAELFDPALGTWTVTGSMIEGRGFHTATLLFDGTVLVAGGANGSGDHHVTDTAEVYDPASRTWFATGSLLIDRKFHRATLLTDGRVLISGGTDGPIDNGWNRLATAELYGPLPGD